MSKARNLSKVEVESTGDIGAGSLDNATPTALSGKANNSTDAFSMPKGTTAQRPASPIVGSLRFNTDLDCFENYTSEGWLKVSIPIPTLTSVSGTIYAGAASTLTLTGTQFGTAAGTVRFVSGATTKDVSTTPASTSSATVTVPSEIYSLSAGSTVSVKFINGDGGQSGTIDKTTVGLPTGGTITTSGSYRIHTFTSSSSLVVPSGFSASAQYLVIGGGGAGGAHHGGGGGAGGYRCSVPGETSGRGSSAEAPITISSGTYTVTIGAGGAGTTTGGSASGPAASGTNSVFGSITSIGGGGAGRCCDTYSGQNGGSGGGSWTWSTSASGGAGTSGQGYDGAGNNGSIDNGGGGGGAGAAGSSRFGGNGLSSSITGSSVTRAGGGAGGWYQGNGQTPGGSGGGGTSAYADGTHDATGAAATSGTTNTGSGGGGSGSYTRQPGNGGSGIVIVRYAL